MQDAVYRETENAAMRGYGFELFLQHNDRVGQTARAQMHEAAEFLYVVSGRYRMLADGLPYEVGPGDLMLFRSGVVHRTDMIAEAPGAYYVLKLHPSLIFSAFSGAGGERFSLFLLTNRPGAPCLFTAAEMAESGLADAFLRMTAIDPAGDGIFARRLSALSFVCELARRQTADGAGAQPHGTHGGKHAAHHPLPRSKLVETRHGRGMRPAPARQLQRLCPRFQSGNGQDL